MLWFLLPGWKLWVRVKLWAQASSPSSWEGEAKGSKVQAVEGVEDWPEHCNEMLSENQK